MFKFLKRKNVAVDELAWMLVAGPEIGSDSNLISGLKRSFQDPFFCSVFLIAYQNLFAIEYAFKLGFANSKECPPTTQNLIRWLANEPKNFPTSSERDQANRNRYRYFYLAALLKLATARARVNPALWDSVANVWVLLIPGARRLGKTLKTIGIFSDSEMEFFSNIETESEGENYFLSFILPEEIREHKTIDERLWLETPPEIRKQIEDSLRGGPDVSNTK